MGGRGSGSTILDNHVGGVAITERGNVKWRTIVADFNPNAGHREVYEIFTLMDFAEVSKKVGKDGCEFLGVMKDGYIVKVAQGINGECTFTEEMYNDMKGNDVTHYHNRLPSTEQEIEEAERSLNEYRALKRAHERYTEGLERSNKAYNEYDEAVKSIRRAGADPDAKNPPARLKSLYEKKDAAWKEYTLGQRQRARAEADFRERYKAYTGNISKSFDMPPMKNVKMDMRGWIGGPFSPQDIDSALFSRDIPTFSASCDEGFYTVAIGNATDNEIQTAQWRLRKLFDTKSPTEEAEKFQNRIRQIDRRTAKEGREKKWSKQRIIATSMNRQMAYLWEKEKEIFGENNISASFTANPAFEPEWEF